MLFFGWVTGAQLIFATYRMHTENLGRLFTLVIVSFTVVVVGYTLISHAFDLFLYPDVAFRSRIYAAAGINVSLVRYAGRAGHSNYCRRLAAHLLQRTQWSTPG